VASVGRRHLQESWVGADQVIELHFVAGRQEVERLRA
jgi:hypothetical protein